MSAAYDDFLARKHVRAAPAGFREELELNPLLLPFQRAAVRWAVRTGRAALFEAPGLGKTFQQLEWARHVAHHASAPVLVLAPLAVAFQTIEEGARFGIPARLVASDADVGPGINVTNYDKLERLDARRFAGVVLDESSILKAYMGKTKRALVAAFASTPYRLCCSATPAPNDHMEIGNHAEFLGVMPSAEMLTRWFINDTAQTGAYRLKGHARDDFWRWVASWAISMRRPSDLGDFDDAGYDLPALRVRTVTVDVDITAGRGDALFREPTLSATELHRELARTAPARAAAVAALVAAEPDESWLLWCNTNQEADELVASIPGAVEVRGSETSDAKERKLHAFTRGETRVLVTKPSIAGFGLNWQHCARVAFVGLSYSFEQFYQALCRTHRFGQARPVDAYVVAAATEGAVGAVVQRKADEHAAMMDAMAAHSREIQRAADGAGRRELVDVAPLETARGDGWELHLGDCVAALRAAPDASADLCVHSPPFSSLYIYSDSVADMGNSADDAEFFVHYDFAIRELYRVLRPGRLCAVHCKQLVNYAGRDGRAGLRDFRGAIIRHYEAAGFALHSEVTIWTDPVLEMQRTKAHGLLYKQLRADSSFSRQGLAEYLVVFRKWAADDDERALVRPVEHTAATFPLDRWQRYASPVWMDVRRTRVLNVEIAREDRDEKHLCPLQLDVIERAVDLWSNPGDVVLDPFTGIGSTGVVALQQGRRFVGAELKPAYWRRACRNLADATRQGSLFAAAEPAAQEAV